MAGRGRVCPRRTETRRTFRLTPAGAAWLASRMPQDPPQPARLSVADDFIVTAPLLTPLLDRFRLARFTDPLPPGGWEQRRETLVPAADEAPDQPGQPGARAGERAQARRRGRVSAAGRGRPGAVKSDRGDRALQPVGRGGPADAGGRAAGGGCEHAGRAARPIRSSRPCSETSFRRRRSSCPKQTLERLLAVLRDSGYQVELS